MSLTPRSQDFSARYNELVEQSWLAQHSAVRGSMVIKPYGFALWENIRDILDQMFKDTGHQNAYFPLFIPKSFFSKEAAHVDWFATESAIVTHYRLKKDEKSGDILVDPDAKLEEELIVRPTSETIIWNTYKDRIQSYRDLPILINQRANVVRWEMRTRLFLRTAEFLWQEWHTAHASAEEAKLEAEKMWNVYDEVLKKALAISGVRWVKSESERFAGAEETYTIEAMMQDGKALQSCTSHDLWQNFGKAFDVQFLNESNKKEYAYATSRGRSTRSIGGLIMSHSDDQWLVLPPAIAPLHVIFVPFFKTQDELKAIQTYLEPIQKVLNIKNFTIDLSTNPYTRKISWKLDDDNSKTPGWKFNEYELQGVPVRITVWTREMTNNQVEIYRRDTGEKRLIDQETAAVEIINTLYDIQSNLFERNQHMRLQNTVFAETYEEFQEALEGGKFVYAHWDGTPETEALIQEECKAVTRCIPLKDEEMPNWDTIFEQWSCIRTGKPSKQRVLFARSY